MKEFEFNEYDVCLNPNEIQIGEWPYVIRIITANFKGKWGSSKNIYIGFCRNCRPLFKNNCIYENENIAIKKELDNCLHWMEYEKTLVQAIYNDSWEYVMLKTFQVKIEKLILMAKNEQCLRDN